VGSSEITAQSASDLAARLHETAATSSIDKAGLSPWHLKVDVQFFDSKGKPSQQGSVEEWWAEPDLYRVTYTMPSYTLTQLRNKDGLFITKGEDYEPALMDDVLGQFVHPMPREADINSAKPDLRHEKFGKVELDCIMLDQPLKNIASPPLALFPTYCLDPGKASLRITTELGSLVFVRNKMGTFQGQSVPLDLTGTTGGITAVTGHLSTLQNMKQSDADFSPGPEMENVATETSRVDSGVMAGMVLSQVQPIYPEAAKRRHITGVVILHAIIGRDGRVQSLHILSTPDADLAMAAVAAVRKWVYKPYIRNGIPVEVETTVIVGFERGP
jgi:TonB family protein